MRRVLLSVDYSRVPSFGAEELHGTSIPKLWLRSAKISLLCTCWTLLQLLALVFLSAKLFRQGHSISSKRDEGLDFYSVNVKIVPVLGPCSRILVRWLMRYGHVVPTRADREPATGVGFRSPSSPCDKHLKNGGGMWRTGGGCGVKWRKQIQTLLVP